jgi:hypothetical protein
MEVSPFVGYAVADNIAITVGLDYASMTTEVEGGDDQEMSASNITIGGAYFFGDNFYAQAGVGLGSSSQTGTDDLSSTQIQIGLGKFIPVKDMWYVSPQFSYGTMSTDGQSGAAASIGEESLGSLIVVVSRWVLYLSPVKQSEERWWYLVVSLFKYYTSIGVKS